MPKLTKKGLESFAKAMKDEVGGNGTLYNEVIIDEKYDSKGITTHTDRLETWYNKKIEEMSKKLLNNKGNSDIEQDCYGKILAYSILVRNDLSKLEDEYKPIPRNKKSYQKLESIHNKQSYKNMKENDKYLSFGFTEDMITELNFMLSTIQDYLKTFISLDENGDIESAPIQKEEKEILKPDKESIEKIRKEKVDNYRNDLSNKINYVTNIYNSSFNGNFKIDRNFVDYAFSLSNDPSNSFNTTNNKKLSLIEKIEQFKESNIKGNERSIENNNSKNVEEQFIEMVETAVKDDVNYSISDKENGIEYKLNDKANLFRGIKTNIQALNENIAKGKIALYIATKKELDKRSGVSKFFHPYRTKKENAKLAEIKEDIKNTLNCGESFFNNIDTLIKNPNANVNFNTINVNYGNGNVDYSNIIEQKVQAYEAKLLYDDIDISLGENEKDSPMIEKNNQNTTIELEKNI